MCFCIQKDFLINVKPYFHGKIKIIFLNFERVFRLNQQISILTVKTTLEMLHHCCKNILMEDFYISINDHVDFVLLYYVKNSVYFTSDRVSENCGDQFRTFLLFLHQNTKSVNN